MVLEGKSLEPVCQESNDKTPGPREIEVDNQNIALFVGFHLSEVRAADKLLNRFYRILTAILLPRYTFMHLEKYFRKVVLPIFEKVSLTIR